MNEENAYRDGLAESDFNSIMYLIEDDESNVRSASWHSANKESVELLVEQLDRLIENNPTSWVNYFIKSNILLDDKKHQKALEIINQGIEKNNVLELYYQKAKILKEIDVNQAIETYLYLMQIDNNAYPCIQACSLAQEVKQMVAYCNLYFEYRPITIDNIESAFAVFALLIREYNKKPFEDFFTILDKIDLEQIKNNIVSDTAEEAFYNIWKLAKAKNVHKALIMYNQLFSDVDILREDFNWNTPKYSFYGLNHYGYGSYKSGRNEFHIQQALPTYNEYSTLLKIEKNNLERVRNIFLHFNRWNIARYIKPVQQKKEWYISISQDTDRWYTSYENIYIAINMMARYVEDAIFFISEDYNVWIDEYNIQNGKLYFERSYAEEEFWDSKRKVIEEKALKREDLRTFISINYVESIYARWLFEENSWLHTKQTSETINTEIENINNKLDKAIHFDSQSTTVYFIKGLLYFRLNKFDEAQKNYKQSLSLDEKNTEALLGLTIIHLNSNAYQNAYSYLKKLISIEPDRKIHYLFTGYICIILNKIEESNSHFEKLFELSIKKAGINVQDQDWIKKIIDYDKYLIAYLNYLDKKIIDLKSKDKEHYSTIKENISLDFVQWGSWLKRWKTWLTDDKKDKVILIMMEFFNKALLYNPKNIEAYIEKAQLLQSIQNIKEAKQLLEEGVKIAPENPKIIAELRDTSMKDKNYDNAIHYALKYIEIVGENASGYGNQSHILYGYLVNAYYAKANELLYTQHQYQEAEELYDKVLELYPKLSAEWKKFEGPWVGKSDVQTFQKKHKQALEYAETAISVNPSSAYAWSAKGSCLNNLGRYEESLTCCDKAIELKPDYFHPWYVKGCVYALTNRQQEALAMIKKTLEFDSTKKEQIKREPDFINLYTNKKFQELVK